MRLILLPIGGCFALIALICIGMFIFKCVPPAIDHDDKLPAGNINKTISDRTSLLAGEKLYNIDA